MNQPTPLGEDGLYDLAMHIRQPEITTSMMKRQLLVIKAETMEDGRLQVVNVHWVFYDVKPKVIGLSIRNSRANAAASHPHSKCSRMVIATGRPGQGRIIFNHRCPPELSTPNHHCFVEQSTLL